MFRHLAHVMHFRHNRQGGALTSAMPLAARLLSPWARARRRGRIRLVRTRRVLALGAVETLGQVADRRFKRGHLCSQGCFTLHRARMLRLPVIRFPRKFNIDLLRQHHTLLGKRRGVVTGFPPQIAEGIVLGLSALHGRCYSRFFWNVLVLYERGTGLA